MRFGKISYALCVFVRVNDDAVSFDAVCTLK